VKLAARVAGALLAAPVLVQAQVLETLRMSAGQEVAGRVEYERECAACHLSSFQGSSEAPQLAGPNFQAAWASRSMNSLRSKVREMPLEAPGSLREAEYDAITVYLLRANGVATDGRTLASGVVTVGSVLRAGGGVSVAASAADSTGGMGDVGSEAATPVVTGPPRDRGLRTGH